MKILVTGVAGFIGMHVTLALLLRGDSVVGVDNLNDYYDPSLKISRLELLSVQDNFKFLKSDISDFNSLEKIFDLYHPDVVLNLAAQAGVRYSLINPGAYVQANITGFLNILECCNKFHIKHLVYASSSSVYGGNQKTPYQEVDSVDHPISFYAATKKTNELMAHTYSHLYSLPTTGLRFFTVYGPWGRPDMALYKFAAAITKGEAIEVYNGGDMIRDFTYIDDVVTSVLRIIDKPAMAAENYDPINPRPDISSAPYKILNIGNSHPENLR